MGWRGWDMVGRYEGRGDPASTEMWLCPGPRWGRQGQQGLCERCAAGWA